LSKIIINENEDYIERKEQALSLSIEINDEMTQEYLEEKIIEKLEDGMKDLKNILDEINLLEV